MFRECFAGRPYPRATRETQLSPSVLTLRIPVMCRAHASFHRLLSRELPMKTLQSSICLSLHTHTHTLSLSHTQPLQLNPTINTWYKRLNKITIKFITEIKPTKQIVVNYNFTDLIVRLKHQSIFGVGDDQIQISYLNTKDILPVELTRTYKNKI